MGQVPGAGTALQVLRTLCPCPIFQVPHFPGHWRWLVSDMFSHFIKLLRKLAAIVRLPGFFSTARRQPESFGVASERLAEKFLKRQGMLIVDRNFGDRFGEIDIVAVEKRTVVFVEVKSRASDRHGEGFEAVDETKQTKMARTALNYLKHNDLLECAYRFDIISMLWPAGVKKPQIEHYRNAFQPTAKNQMFG